MNYLVVGLGNVGSEYANTRHNAGFMVLDAWAQASNAVFRTQRYGDVAEISFKGRHVTLLKPSTYMNLSGNAVRYWVTKLKLPMENLLVVCDDLNLPFGVLRMRKKGSDGGHNGLKNIQELLGSQEYNRLRVGIGNDFAKGGQIDFVIGEMTETEKAAMPEICKRAVDGILAFLTVGPDRAMTVLNASKAV